MRRRLSGRLWMAMKNSTWLAVDSTAVFVCGHRSLTLATPDFHFMRGLVNFAKEPYSAELRELPGW